MRLRVFITILLSILAPTTVRAFSVSPLSFSTNIDPGKTGTVWIDVINNENIDQTYQLGVVGSRQNNLGQPIFKINSDLAEGWVVPEKKEIFVKANDIERVLFNIQVPKNSAPGSHYLGLFVEPKTDIVQIGVKGRLLTLLTLRVSGLATEKLVIKKWIGEKNFLLADDLNFGLNVANNGNVDVPLQIKVSLYDSNSKKIEEKEVLAGANLMAGLERKYQIDFSSLNIKPGKYYATVQINYGLTKQQISEIKSFWFFPQNTFYYIVGFVLIIILFLSIIFFLRRKSYVQTK